MPISAENRGRYPADWPELRARILVRAGGRCEQCGVPNHARIVRMIEDPFVWEIEAELILAEGYEPDWDAYHSPVQVVLTCAHLNHTPEDNREENIAALCQRCHLVYDREEHEQSRRRNRDRRAGQTLLFPEGVKP